MIRIISEPTAVVYDCCHCDKPCDGELPCLRLVEYWPRGPVWLNRGVRLAGTLSILPVSRKLKAV